MEKEEFNWKPGYVCFALRRRLHLTAFSSVSIRETCFRHGNRYSYCHKLCTVLNHTICAGSGRDGKKVRRSKVDFKFYQICDLREGRMVYNRSKKCRKLCVPVSVMLHCPLAGAYVFCSRKPVCVTTEVNKIDTGVCVSEEEANAMKTNGLGIRAGPLQRTKATRRRKCKGKQTGSSIL